MNLGNIQAEGKTPVLSATRCVTAFVQDAQDRQMHTDRRQVSAARG